MCSFTDFKVRSETAEARSAPSASTCSSQPFSATDFAVALL